MESHFQNVLKSSVASDPKESFILARTFQGSKVGYCFRNGDKGVGYYLDKVQQSKQSSTELLSQKRKLEADDDEAEDAQPLPKRSYSSKQPINIEKLLEESENNEIVQLTPDSLRQMLSNLDKKITKNQKMRMKYAEEPEKFMESELELHQQIEELHMVATSPELYPILYESSGLQNMVNLISHENTDVSLAAISWLQEVLDHDLDLSAEIDHDEDDTQLATLHTTYALVERLVGAYGGLEMLVQNLTRLQDEKDDDDAQGVYHTLQILDSLFDLTTLAASYIPEVMNNKQNKMNGGGWNSARIGHHLCRQTNLLHYLLHHQLQHKAFTMNKTAASELLTILFQAEQCIPLYLLQLSTTSGCDALPTVLPPSTNINKITVYAKKQQYYVFPSSSSSASSGKVNGLELLLQAIAIYRKREVTIPEEQECVENLFLALKTVLLSHPIFQDYFVFDFEGIELMFQCILHKSYAFQNAFHTLNYVLMYCPIAGLTFIHNSGLKYLFSYLLSLQSFLHPTFNHNKKSTKKKLSLEKQEKETQFEESLISIITQLVIQVNLTVQQGSSAIVNTIEITNTRLGTQWHKLPFVVHSNDSNNNNGEAENDKVIQEWFHRMYTKWTEHEGEKLHYVLQLLVAYEEKYMEYESTVARRKQELEELLAMDPEDITSLEEYELLLDEEYMEQQRLDSGLFMYQQMITMVSGILAMDCMLSSSSSTSVVWKTVTAFLARQRMTLEDDILLPLRAMIVKLTPSEEQEEGEDEEQENKKKSERGQMEEQYRKTFIQWSAIIAKAIQGE